MKMFLSLFKNRWMQSFLGILAIAILIWYLGPYIAIAHEVPLESPTTRQWTIVGLFALWGLNQIRQYWLAKQNEQKLQEALKQAPPDIVQTKSNEEIADLTDKFDESLLKLKNELGGSRFSRKYLYQLPWYIIIGRSRAGKTTSLKTANLNYIQKVQGVGSTQNCDWFFTNEAVLIDTAGRYVSQDIYHDVDRAGWQGFLDLLKKYRPRRPINGAIIAVSIAELLEQNEVEREEHALAIRTRLQELHDRLGIRIPVYLLFTKSDLLAGFVEFFDDLGPHERSQVWGITLPLYADLHTPVTIVLDDFIHEFQALEQRLYQRLLRRLQDERNNQLRDFIYTFPQQFGAVRPLIEQFLTVFCQPNMRKEILLLRGVYFTSGTQVGTPIDRAIASIVDTFRLDRRILSEFKIEGKSYFVKRLLQEVVFPEAGLANTNLYLERQRTWLQRIAFTGALGLLSLLSLAWVTSYVNNQTYIEGVKNKLTELIAQCNQLRPNQTDVLSVLPLLETASKIPGGYDKPDADLFYTFGLYQGDTLGQSASDTYIKLLSDTLLPRLMIHLEEELRLNSAKTDTLYETLKIYLMLGDSKSAHFDEKMIKSWVEADWQKNLGRNIPDEQRQTLSKHLNSLLANYPDPNPFSLDSVLIEKVQKRLREISLEQRVYDQLKSAGLRESSLTAFNVSEEAAPNAVRVFERSSRKYLSEGVPGFFSYKGYHQVFMPAVKEQLDQMVMESWVMGNQTEVSTPENKKHLANEVRRLYLEDYVKQWKVFLNDINIRPLPSSDPQQAVEIVKILSDPINSPLRKLLIAVDRETSLERQSEQSIDKTPSQESSGVRGLIERIPGAGRITETVSEATGLIVAPAGPNLVDDSFADLHRLVQSGMDNLIHGLDDLYRNLDAINNASSDQERSAANKQIGTVIAKLLEDANFLPDSIRPKIQGLAQDIDNQNKGRTRAYLNDLWKAEVLPFCRQALDGYPILQDSIDDITPADFGKFFGTGGIMDTFFQSYLQGLVDVSHKPWRWNEKAGDMSQQALLVFQQAAEIKKVFFNAGQETIFKFDLTPIRMDAEADQSLLDVGGQEIVYQFGSASPVTMKWPSPNNNQQVRLVFKPPAESGTSGFTLQGPWAWLRALDRQDTTVKVTRHSALYSVTFHVGKHYVTYELRADSAFNPFNVKELHKFNCPDRL